MLFSPVNNTVILNCWPHFKWSDPSDGIFFDVMISSGDTTFPDKYFHLYLDSCQYISQVEFTPAKYYWRVRSKDFLGNWGVWCEWESFIVPTTFKFTDIDGNIYKLVKIGNQWWMAENLRVTHYRNGDRIPNVSTHNTWATLSTGARCSYNNDESNIDIYGYLYNWFAIADKRGLAPHGWHIPTIDEWRLLIRTVCEEREFAGGKLKENSTDHWLPPNAFADNESGFTALPGGYRNCDYWGYNYLGERAFFWAAPRYEKGYAMGFYLVNGHGSIGETYFNKEGGYSVRCIKDVPE
jgi:uncharacterized protein (TIGR02145 family)